MSSFFVWTLLGGLLFAHLFDVVAYRPSEFLKTPWILIDPRQGWSVSSFGGFLGGVLIGAFWARQRRLHLLPYIDAMVYGVAPGWALGRLACFATHDHIGKRTDFFLAVAFPGGPRHDLGLDEALLVAALAVCFRWLYRRNPAAGTYPALACLCYGPMRFLLDSLRATDISYADPRYLGFTPGQYCAIALTCAGVVLSVKLRHSPLAPAASTSKNLSREESIAEALAESSSRVDHSKT
jgi:phosphatidylglycerol:prolipoprotein diacylglycerol transferase